MDHFPFFLPDTCVVTRLDLRLCKIERNKVGGRPEPRGPMVQRAPSELPICKTSPFRMFHLQSDICGQRAVRETQFNPGFMPTWIPGVAQLLATNQATGEQEPSTYGLKLPTNLQNSMTDLTRSDNNREIFEDQLGPFRNTSMEAGHEFPDQNLPNAAFLGAHLGTPPDEERMGTFCNSPNLLEFNGFPASGVCDPVLMGPFADAPPPGDFESRSNWNFAMHDTGFVAAPSVYRNGASKRLADFPLRFPVDGNSDQGCFVLSNSRRSC
jgi:hypothetical protein